MLTFRGKIALPLGAMMERELRELCNKDTKCGWKGKAAASEESGENF